MKTLMARTGVDCTSEEINVSDLDFDLIIGKAVLFRTIEETEETRDAFDIALLDVDHHELSMSMPVSEQEALDMLPEVPKACSGFIGKFGVECDKCSRYQDECNGTGEFHVI